MAEGDRTAGTVDLLRIDLADRLAPAELLLSNLLRSHPLDVRQDLRGERLVHLDHADVLQTDLRPLERYRQRKHGTLKKLVERVQRCKRVTAEVTDGLDAHRL